VIVDKTPEVETTVVKGQ
jgi:hypothetical protein